MLLERGEFYGSPTLSRSIGPIEIVVSRYAPGVRNGRHAHPAPTMYVVLAGAVEDHVERHHGEQRPGYCVVQRPGQEHATAFSDVGATVANIQLDPAWFDRVTDSVRLPAPGVGVRTPLAGRLIAELARDDGCTEKRIETVVQEMLLSAHRGARARSAAEPELVRSAEALIERRSPAPASLSEVADILGVERTRLAHAFRRWRGLSVGEHIRLKRIEDARVLIGSTDLPLASIAAQAGFADQSHLTRDFHKATGVTPAAWRKTIEQPASR